MGQAGYLARLAGRQGQLRHKRKSADIGTVQRATALPPHVRPVSQRLGAETLRSEFSAGQSRADAFANASSDTHFGPPSSAFEGTQLLLELQKNFGISNDPVRDTIAGYLRATSFVQIAEHSFEGRRPALALLCVPPPTVASGATACSR